MNVQRGDVALVDYPYASGTGTKVRPVLVIQNDRDNQRLLNTIVVKNHERNAARFRTNAVID